MHEIQNLNEPIHNSFASSKVQVIRYYHEWKIHNFHVIGKDPGEFIMSPQFSFADNTNIKWCLKLYPKSRSSDDKDYLSLFLHCESFQGLTKIETDYEISILNNDRKKCFTSKYTYTFTKADGYGTPKFAKISDIMNDIYLPNDCLTIVCNITAGLNNITTLSRTAIDNVVTDEKPQLKLLSNYESLLNNQKFSDVTIIISEKKLCAHKAILAAHSPVFTAMFDNTMKESHENTVEITDIEFNVFQELLRFIYSGKIENMDTVVNDLLVAADKYSIKELLIECEQYLQSNLNVDNIMNVLALADNHNATNLKTRAIQIIINHKKEIANINDFEFLETLNQNTLKMIAKLALQ